MDKSWIKAAINLLPILTALLSSLLHLAARVDDSEVQTFTLIRSEQETDKSKKKNQRDMKVLELFPRKEKKKKKNF